MRSPQADRDGTRTIRGSVIATSGAIKSGTGFTVVRNSAGNFTVRFSGLRAILSINAAIQQSGGFIVANPSSVDTVTITVYNTTTVQADFDWSFEVTGLAR